LNEYIVDLREARDSYVAYRNQALRLLNSSEISEYNKAKLNVESKQMYVESATIAVADWISDARRHGCASGSDLDRTERAIASIFLIVKDGERNPLPKRGD